MGAREQMIWIFGGIVALLAVASLVGAVLGKRARSESGRATIENLQARVNAWWVMTAVLAITLALGDTATLIVFGLVSFFALREFITLTPTRRSDYYPLVLAFYVILPAQYLLIACDQYGTFAIFIPVYGFLLLPTVATLVSELIQVTIPCGAPAADPDRTAESLMTRSPPMVAKLGVTVRTAGSGSSGRGSGLVLISHAATRTAADSRVANGYWARMVASG